jgi:hypothetical protein
MKQLNVLNRSWQIGDTIEVTGEQLEKMTADLYDSYDQTYVFDKMKWKLLHHIAHADGSTIYTLAAVEKL